MPESFKLTVPLEAGTQDFDAQLHVFGYTHKISVFINGNEMLFEPDEERNYRAILPDPQANNKGWDIKLIAAVANALQEAFS